MEYVLVVIQVVKHVMEKHKQIAWAVTISSLLIMETVQHVQTATVWHAQQNTTAQVAR